LGVKTLALASPSPVLLGKLAVTMAREDRQEIWGYDHSTPLEGLERGVSQARESWCLVNTAGEPVCAFGIQELSLLTTTACFWLLGSILIPHYRVSFLRWSRAWIEERGPLYENAVNYVGDWHVRSQRWLQWMGFTLSEPFTYGIEQWPWREATRKGSQSWG